MSTISLIPIEGLPEVRPGDVLAELIASATTELRDGDVVVVTQKVVSKAEGRMVEIDAADPRSHKPLVEREAVRVLRRRDDLLITETAHGFVCANGGIDASNVGPDSGSIVTLLPDDSDASAERIRAAVRESTGVDVPVVISDSFGRPWRFGIVDVAIGVAGLLPLDDLRGTADHDGRVMTSTVRAVADELASAAELTLGKRSGRPVALVRGAAFTRGEGTIRDVVMPESFDLFR